MFEQTFGIPYYGLDEGGRIKTETLLQFLQEAAGLHANSINIGVADLLKQDMTWVLRRYRVNIKSLPGKCGLNVRTWFEPHRNLFSVRVFEVTTQSGNLVADAWSAWIVVDLKRGRPIRLDHALPDTYFAVSEPTGEPVTEEIASIGESFDHERAFQVRRRELDLNGHANHTAYFDWAMESIPDEEITDLSPARLDAEFLSSVKRECVTVKTKKTSDHPGSFTHEITAEDGVLAAKIVTVWNRQHPFI
ncbi:MAG: thioesterase [Synergistaceae bacterium]|nr:thioesterase [Synergistaceae bacterium]